MADRRRHCVECGAVYVARKPSHRFCSRSCAARVIGRRQSPGARAKMLAILRFVADYRAEHDFAPAIREIQEHVGISSTSVVAYHLDALQRLGYIRHTPQVSRSIVVLPAGHEALQ